MERGQRGAGLGYRYQQQQNKGVLLFVSTGSWALASCFACSQAKKTVRVLNTIQVLTVQQTKERLGEVSRTGAPGRKVQVGIVGLV